jgi:hypothetical protein
MTMRKIRLATLLATVACCGAVGVANASATEYVHHVGIGSGGNYFGPFVSLYASEVIGYGQGIGCAGIRGVSGVVCEPEPGASAAVILGSRIKSEPYIHNHATFTSYFNGYYYN